MASSSAMRSSFSVSLVTEPTGTPTSTAQAAKRSSTAARRPAISAGGVPVVPGNSRVGADQGGCPPTWFAMFRILYRFLASLARLAVSSGRSKDLEIIVLRHQLNVLRRQVDRPAVTDDVRTLLAAIAAALPRRIQGELAASDTRSPRPPSGRSSPPTQPEPGPHKPPATCSSPTAIDSKPPRLWSAIEAASSSTASTRSSRPRA